MLGCEFLHIVLPGKLGLSVNGNRVGHIELRVRRSTFSVKHIVRGELYHLRLHFRSDDCKVSCAECIDFVRHGRILLTGFNVGHSGTVDNNVRAVHLPKP